METPLDPAQAAKAPPIAVVVLAGGEGRRMGGAKPLRRLGDTTLVAHALALARTWSAQVAVAVRDAAQVGDEVDAPLILDDPALAGPLAGLASAFGFANQIGAARLLTLPCDAPALPSDLLARLARGLSSETLVAVAASGGVLQPVCALWRVQAAARLPAYLATGRRALGGFAAHCGMATVDWPAGDIDPFANANTPEELAALQPPV
ncbi:molybdenum cofactor guanylyltransferase [Phenylobacterium sp.]|uniref:molybdenum cofactor guanylyltransferase n=1 Tax=Phenylobacterium sp. TaxID=1871053 RepID=UPI0025EDE1A0|nr:molybdenum cofactor guanylyltransferase [Phenylobacterium sp.]